MMDYNTPDIRVQKACNYRCDFRR